DTSQLVEDMDYGAIAELLGLRGINVREPEEMAAAWDAAFASDRPVVLNVYTDANVPPRPAHISFEQAKGFLSRLIKGDPAQGAVIRTSIRAMGAELFENARSKLPFTSDNT